MVVRLRDIEKGVELHPSEYQNLEMDANSAGYIGYLPIALCRNLVTREIKWFQPLNVPLAKKITGSGNDYLIR